MGVSLVFLPLVLIADPLPAQAPQGDAHDLHDLWHANLDYAPNHRVHVACNGYRSSIERDDARAKLRLGVAMRRGGNEPPPPNPDLGRFPLAAAPSTALPLTLESARQTR